MLDVRDAVTHENLRAYVKQDKGTRAVESVRCEVDISKLSEATQSTLKPITNSSICDLSGVGKTREDALKVLLTKIDIYATLVANYQNAVHMEIARIQANDAD